MTLSDAGMRAFRMAATLVDIVPSIEVRIRDGQRLLLKASHAAPNERTHDAFLPSCSFRAARRQGFSPPPARRAPQFCRPPSSREPTIDIGLRSCDAVLPGDIYRIAASGGGHLLFFVTELDVASSERCISEAIATSNRCGTTQASVGHQMPHRVGFHADALTELTAVHTIVPNARTSDAVALMTRLMELCVVEEVVLGVGCHSRDDVTPQ